jgi:hypothetical protein
MSPAPPFTAPFNDNLSTAEAHTPRLPLPGQATQQRDSRTQGPATVIPMVKPYHRGTSCGAQVRSVCSEFLKCDGAVAADVAGVDGAFGLEEEC